MITKNEVAKVFDTIFSTPGMNEMVKMDLKISRKNVLLVSHFIEQGLLLEKDPSSIMGSLSEEGFSELKNVSQECLQKAGLTELNQKLLSLRESYKS